MQKKFVAFLGLIMMAVGLLGFFVPNLAFLVQFDLFQNFIYAVFGAVGIKFGFGTSSSIQQLGYLRILASVNLLLLMLGLSWPNLGDLFHLEVPEHFFHGTVGIVAALSSDFLNKKGA